MKYAIQNWVKGQGGKLVKVYVDEAQSGRDENRPGFQEMRRDARKGKFDALVVHKFDRLARNRANSLAFKSLLRHDYGIKVLSVTEPSEDSDGPLGALIEGIMEAVAEWYSRNLATEVAKGKLEANHFSPLITHSSPSRCARQVNWPGSAPACGSVIE